MVHYDMTLDIIQYSYPCDTDSETGLRLYRSKEVVVNLLLNLQFFLFIRTKFYAKKSNKTTLKA